MKDLSLILFTLVHLSVSAQTFTLRSTDAGGQAMQQHVYNGFGCTGSNVSPQLYWENPPEGTKSFAVTMHDEDAPTGSGWWHWLIFDIGKNNLELKSNAGNLTLRLAPEHSIQSKTDFGSSGYGGPCPPQGDGIHRYVITVHALNIEKLGLDENANPALVGFMAGQRTIEKASLIIYYKRP